MKDNKNPHWEGFGRLEAEPTKKQFHWYEKQSIDLSRLHCSLIIHTEIIWSRKF